MVNKDACFTSNTDNWSTPKYLYDYLNKIHKFDFDPCPLNPNPNIDGLSIDWGESNYINPPYSNIEGFVKKAIER